MHAEDSIQRPKANGCVRHFGWWCGNSPYLTCKFLQELKEPEKQVSKEVCCCVGEGGRADGRVGVRALNDNTGGIQILLVTLVPSVWHFIPLCLTVNADVRESYHKTKNPGNTCSSFIDLNGIWWKKNTHFKSNEAKYQKSTCPYQNKCSVVSKYNCCND